MSSTSRTTETAARARAAAAAIEAWKPANSPYADLSSTSFSTAQKNAAKKSFEDANAGVPTPLKLKMDNFNKNVVVMGFKSSEEATTAYRNLPNFTQIEVRKDAFIADFNDNTQPTPGQIGFHKHRLPTTDTINQITRDSVVKPADKNEQAFQQSFYLTRSTHWDHNFLELIAIAFAMLTYVHQHILCRHNNTCLVVPSAITTSWVEVSTNFVEGFITFLIWALYRGPKTQKATYDQLKFGEDAVNGDPFFAYVVPAILRFSAKLFAGRISGHAIWNERRPGCFINREKDKVNNRCMYSVIGIRLYKSALDRNNVLPDWTFLQGGFYPFHRVVQMLYSRATWDFHYRRGGLQPWKKRHFIMGEKEYQKLLAKAPIKIPIGNSGETITVRYFLGTVNQDRRRGMEIVEHLVPGSDGTEGPIDDNLMP